MILTRKRPAKEAAAKPKPGGDEKPHPNRQRFEGCLTLVDTPSDAAPNGAQGHRIILSREAAEAALPGLIGMPIGFKDTYNGHNVRQRCGVIDQARIEEKRILVAGYVFCYDFPDFVDRAAEHEAIPKLGMSYELKGADILNRRRAVWTVVRCHFVGAAVLQRETAAYRDTFFRLLPHAKVESVLSLDGIVEQP